MTRATFSAALTLALFLTACGDHLGTYDLEEVRQVEAAPAIAVDGRKTPSASRYFKIQLSSGTNLYAANTGPGLYTDADFCPLRDPNRLIAFGPIASDGKAVEDYKREDALKPGPDGRYHYFVYLASSSARRKLFDNSEDFMPAYDIGQRPKDVCIRFFVPGYNIVPSRSDIMRIPANKLVAAARKGAA
jgi:hypothetical protein